MKNTLQIFILILVLITGPSSAQTKPLFGTYTFEQWSCCFSVNCADKYVLILKKDSSYVLERSHYNSPIKGKWWKYTLTKYEREECKWNVKNDTLTLSNDKIYGRTILVKNNKLISARDYMLLEIYGKDFLELHPQIKERQFKKKKAPFFNRKKSKKHVRHKS